MKKIITAVLLIAICFSFTGCFSEKDKLKGEYIYKKEVWFSRLDEDNIEIQKDTHCFSCDGKIFTCNGTIYKLSDVKKTMATEKQLKEITKNLEVIKSYNQEKAASPFELIKGMQIYFLDVYGKEITSDNKNEKICTLWQVGNEIWTGLLKERNTEGFYLNMWKLEKTT